MAASLQVELVNKTRANLINIIIFFFFFTLSIISFF